MKYAFILGREYKLSLAELISLFGEKNLIDFNEGIAIFEIETLQKNILQSLGGTTRIIEIISEISPESFPTEVISYIEKNFDTPKISFALASFGVKMPLSEMWMRMKKSLSKNFSVRFLNAKNENIHSAVFKREKLGRSETEFAMISMSEKKFWKEAKSENHKQQSKIQNPLQDENISTQKYFFGKTIACQDIDAYSRRDTGKTRDMVVGMMPPKLVQMMINLAISEKKNSENKKNIWNEKFEAEKKSNHSPLLIGKMSEAMAIYDPFCGLGTTLIEAANMNFSKIFGSDISEEMIQNSEKSLENFIKEEKLWQERIKNAGGIPQKNFDNLEYKFFTLDATKIEKAFEMQKIPKNVLIISEGFLGKIMKKHEMTQDAVFSERRAIHRLYDKFFEGLKNAKFDGKIVMSFPFWKVQNVYIFLDEITEIIQKHGFAVENLLPRELGLNTKNGTLLYRRESQNVGREIIKIIKK